MIGVIVPDRGDRKKLLLNCKLLILNQTIQPDHVAIINHKPTSRAPDLTQRVRKGFEKLRLIGCECVLIIENDDFYQPDYIEEMLSQWNKAGKPEIFGTSSTLYYHIIKNQYRVLNHPNRSSLMSTLLRCDAPIVWPADSEIFLDLHLWKQLDGKTFDTTHPIAIGIKHGQGLCGGKGHSQMLFDNDDLKGDFLRSLIDEESVNFYEAIAGEIRSTR
jgi:hypothetical protein